MATRAAPRRTPRRATTPRAGLQSVHARVLSWFDEHGRHFPWREHRDPYRTMVAEVMLQQTQTGRVAPVYGEFLAAFPTLQRLAHAPAMDVIRAWRGLGYNRRAVDLQRAAQAIEHDFGGLFPADGGVLRTLPGLGDYTSSAIACFAFDVQVPVVDVNVRRVLSRAVIGSDPEEAGKQAVDRVAAEWLPRGEAYRWNQALMDIGAMLCRSGQPLCTKCPLRSACAFRASGKTRAPRPARPAREPFEGSRRQKRGGIVDALREAAHDGITLAALAKAVHPDGGDRDLSWLVALLDGLERDGLVEMSEGARRGSPRGVVRLPR